MKAVEEINIEEYNYPLTEEKIAFHPLEERDASRLLIYKDGYISEDNFKNLTSYLPKNSLLVFNDTRVVNARIVFTKNTGGKIEIFCLEPANASVGYDSIFSAQGSSQWKCFIGGASKWKEGDLSIRLETNGIIITVTATLNEKREGYFIVTFSWTPPHFSFSEIIDMAGSVPLPPYIKRTGEDSDKTRYQTLFARKEGSVAAPTAALHFSESIMRNLEAARIEIEKITLHVGAGTFKPVMAKKIGEHQMHAEWIDVSRKAISNLAKKDFIIAVGTTSLRTIESLYWIGVKIMRNDFNHHIGQWEIYQDQFLNCTVSYKDSFEALTRWMMENKMERLFTQTSILIAPGYKMRVAKALITNFHQPKSTLLLLVAAAIGKNWKSVYAYALEKNFRFLSYGDANLLFFPQG